MQTDAEMVKAILCYFLRNPRAADSLEGVARWRLLEEAVHSRVRETQQALTWLVDAGFLCEATTAETGSIFSLNSEKQVEAEEFLMASSLTGQTTGG